ncbi:MAG: hypothetical protein JXN64_10575 [Spirochaetes bacterium]|nr:hypothetical protein [Spirochaetota bacterium]
MADYKIVQKLDEKLIKEGIIDSAFKDDYRKVHTKLNMNYKKSGAILPSKIFDKNETKLRKWLGELYKKGASQERLTSYLRCGLAHLSFDFIESSYQSIGKDDLLTRALQSFKNREFHKTYYKATDTAIMVKKKRIIKKKASKKVKKKIISVKSDKKKKAVKKSPSGTAKPKKTVKKAVRKNQTVKKTAKTKSTGKKKRSIKFKLFK